MDIINQVQPILQQISDAMSKYAPIVGELTIESARVMALQGVISGIFFIIVLFFCIRYGYKFVKISYYNPDNMVGLVAIPLSFAGIALGVSVYQTFFQAINWIGVIRPEVYLAYMILKKAM